jgi:hypothetical protein
MHFVNADGRHRITKREGINRWGESKVEKRNK